MNTVYLHGGIGKRFGRKYQVDARNSQEVIKALDANNEGFLAYIVKQELEGNRHFLLAKHPDKLKSEKDLIDNIIAENEINREIHVVPSVYGGFIASWLIPLVGKTAAAAMSSALWGGLAQMAISALQKTPDDKVKTRGESDTSKSFLLGASRETASQGGSIPLGYGRVFIGPSLVSQSMTTTRLPIKNNKSKILESTSQLKFSHLICEGPIEGPVNEYGAKVDSWFTDENGIKVPHEDVQRSLYINENQLLKGEFYNYNLNETADLPSINISKEDSRILDDSVSIIHTINQELFGVSPYFVGELDKKSDGSILAESKRSTFISESDVFPEKKDAEKPTIFSHKVSNIDTRQVVISFRSSVFLQRQSDGETQSERVYFGIFVVDDDGRRENVLESPANYTLRFNGNKLVDSNGNELNVYKDENNRMYVYGIATSSYQFEFFIRFRKEFKKNPPTIQIVKMSKETDIAAASNIYTTWTTTKRRWWGGKKVTQHEKTDWNSIGGQGRTRSISVSTIEEMIPGKFSNPNAVTSRIIIDSLNFASQPTFMWHLKLKKVLVPSNYNPITRQYSGPWNGLFKGQELGQSIYSIDERNKEWTDNPAWIFYDLVSNPTYGCGKYGVEQNDIDKWQAYKIAKYCDQMVETNYPIQTDSGLLKAFEFYGSGGLSIDGGQVGKNNITHKFKIKIDKTRYSKNQSGTLDIEEANDIGFETYHEFLESGDYTLTIPEGIEQIEVLTIGAGGSGQAMSWGQNIYDVIVLNGNNGENSVVSSSSGWSVVSQGGIGGGLQGDEENLVARPVTVIDSPDDAYKIYAQKQGSLPEFEKGDGRDRLGTQDLLISGSSGSRQAAKRSWTNSSGKSSNTPGFGSGSGAGSQSYYLPLIGTVSLDRVIMGGGSAAASVVRLEVSPGDTITINVGAGGNQVQGKFWDGRDFSKSAKGGSGKVVVEYISEGGYTGLSSRQQFIKSFGDGDLFKGKSVAFFINKHNYGSSALEYKQQIKNKSILKQNCSIERRQIVSSDADNFTIDLMGADFTLHESAFDGLIETLDKPLKGGVSIEAGSNTVTGTNTEFIEELDVGDKIKITDQEFTVQEINSDTELILDDNHIEGAESVVAYTQQTSKRYIMYGACAAEIDHPIVEPRFTANLYLKDAVESINILNMFANMFRARLSYSSGKISIQQDSKNLAIQLFNNTNVSIEGFAYSGSQKDQRFSVVKVMFNNKENEFNQEYVYEEDTAAIQKIGIIETEINALSVSSESEARRLAKWILMSAQYEQEVVKFTTGQEGAYTFPGAVIEIYDQMRAGDLRSGRVLDVIDAVDSGSQTYILIDKSILKEPILGDVEFTVSAGADNTTLEKIEARSRNEKFVSDQDYEIENLKSQQVLKFQARLIPDQDESRSRVIDMVAKMQFELSLEKSVFEIFYHGFEDGDKIRFASDGVLPSGLSPFEEYYVICSTKHSFKVSLYPPVYLSGTLSLNPTGNSGLVANIVNGVGTSFTTELNVGDYIIVDGFDFVVQEIKSDSQLIINKSHTRGFTQQQVYTNIIPVSLFDVGKDRLLNIGGEHFVMPIDQEKTQEKINQIMIGAIYSIRGDIGLIEENRGEVTSVNLAKIGVNEILTDDWLTSTMFGQVKIVDANWMYARNLGWVYIKDILNKESASANEYFWFYTGQFGWVGTTEVLKNTTWYVPALRQNKDGATGFVNIKYDVESGNISNAFVYYESIIGLDESIQTFNLGSSNKKLGRLCEVKEVRTDSPYGYVLNISDYDEDIGQYNVPIYSDVFNQEKYDAIKIESASKMSPGESLQQRFAVRLNIINNLEFDLSKNYNIFIQGISGSDSELINKTWNFIFINETTLELADSAEVGEYIDGYDFTNAYLYLVKEFDHDLKKFIEGKYFKVLNNKEVVDGKYEITATEYSYDKFDAIDKKGVIRRPVIPIPPQEGMEVPEAPTNLVLTSSTE